MRHGKKFNHLGRTASHRSAMLSNMASSLIKHKRINTTVAKAKALRSYVEPILTKAKDDTTHARRVAFSYLQDKESVHELFANVADKIANRPGGYTRILKTGYRLGDNAEMCIMELVDFNDLMLEDAKPKKSRRSRRGKGKKSADVQAAAVTEESAESTAAEQVADDTSEEKVEDVKAAEGETAEEAAAEVTEESKTGEVTEEPQDAAEAEASEESQPETEGQPEEGEEVKDEPSAESESEGKDEASAESENKKED